MARTFLALTILALSVTLSFQVAPFALENGSTADVINAPTGGMGCALSGGGYVTVWVSKTAGTTATSSRIYIKSQLYNADGSANGSPVSYDTQLVTAGFQMKSGVACLSNGGYAIAYKDISSSSVSIVRFSSRAGYIGTTTRSSTSSTPSIAACGSGFVVSDVSVNQQAVVEIFNIDAASQKTIPLPTLTSFMVSMVFKAGNGFLLTLSPIPSLGKSAPSVQLYDSQGNAVGNVLNPPTDYKAMGTSDGPVIATRLSGGNYAVVWTYLTVLFQQSAVIAVYDSSWTLLKMLPAFGPVTLSQGSLAPLANGDFVLAWSGVTTLNLNYGVYSNRGEWRTGDLAVALQGIPTPWVIPLVDGSFSIGFSTLGLSVGVSIARFDNLGKSIDLSAGCNGCLTQPSSTITNNNSTSTNSFTDTISNALNIFSNMMLSNQTIQSSFVAAIRASSTFIESVLKTFTRPYVRSSIRYDIDFDKFTTNSTLQLQFAYKIASIAKVLVSQIKFLSITKGSTVIDFAVEEGSGTTASQIQNSLNQGLTNNQLALEGVTGGSTLSGSVNDPVTPTTSSSIGAAAIAGIVVGVLVFAAVTVIFVKIMMKKKGTNKIMPRPTNVNNVVKPQPLNESSATLNTSSNITIQSGYPVNMGYGNQMNYGNQMSQGNQIILTR